MNFNELSLEDKVVFSLVTILLLFLAYSEAFKNISVYLIIIIFFIKFLSRKIKITYDLINISLLLHLIIVLMGIKLGINSKESLNQYMDVVHIVFIFLFFREANLNYFSYEKILNLLFIGFIFAALIGIYNLYMKGYRLNLHSVGSVNRSAVYIMYIFVTSLTLFGCYKSKFSRLIFFITLLISIVSLLLGASRMAVLSLPLVVLFYLVNAKKTNFKSIVLIGLLFTLSVLIYEQFDKDSLLLTKLAMGINDIPRIQIWVSSIQAWIQNNSWFGIGVGNSIYINVQDFFPESALTHNIDNTHNLFLDMLLERGVFGLLTFLVFSVSIFFIKGSNSKIDIFIRTLTFSLLLMGLANITFRYEFAIIFVVLVGAYLNPSIKK